MSIEAVFSSITLALIGASLFSYLANKLKIRLEYEMTPTETYVGSFPYWGAIIGCIAGFLLNSQDLGITLNIDWFLLGIIFVFSVIGFFRDKFRLNKAVTYFLALIASFTSLYFYIPGAGTEKLLYYSGLVVVLIASLKAASFVYEMPFVLISSTAITHILYLIYTPGDYLKIILIEFSLVTFAVAEIIYTFSGNRSLVSNSGLFATGVALGMASILEPSGGLILLDFFLPVMIIVFPALFICALIGASYFANRLHKKDDATKRNWNWSLNREKVILFTALIFLCMNLSGLLVMIKANTYCYAGLAILFVLSMISFVRAFARKLNEEGSANAKINVLGVNIDAVTSAQVLERIKNYIAKPNSDFLHIITADSLAIVRTKKEPDFKAKMDAAEMVVPDGAGIVWAADFLGTPLPGRVPGVALVSQICEASVNEGHKIFFIGSKPGVAKKAVEIIKDKTGANIVGVEHGYFKADSDEEKDMLQKIADSRADIVFVALGVPRQEDFITKLRNYTKHIVAVGVGGSFDVISGSLPRAPQWMQNCGVEWLFRLWLEPKRIGRMMEIPVFVLKVMRYKLNRD